MVNYIKLRKGLNIPIDGVPQPQIVKSIVSETYALKPTDFKGLIPKLVVREGDAVLAGTPIFIDKQRPEIKFTSPVSGVVSEIVRGEKRKLLEVRIKADSQIEYRKFDVPSIESLTPEQAKELLLESGMWAGIQQRPYGIIPSPDVEPKAIYISGFSTAPLAPDYDYTLRDDFDNIQTAVNVLSKIVPDKVHIGLNALTHASSILHKIKGVEFHIFDGPHPAGNVGVQIHHVCPVNKGDIVWTIDIQFLAIIGRFFRKGICDYSKIISIGGPRVKNPGYVKCIGGFSLSNISDLTASDNLIKLQENCDIRYISGDVLTGTNVGKDGFLGFHDNQISLITEGNYKELFGWAKIIRPKKFSLSKTYFSWLTPSKRYKMDSNLNGGPRAFVLTNKYADVLPMDILPVYLIKAILAKDIDKMEQLGIYEVIEEDLALCEYICPSKIEFQQILSEGIELMIKEMA